MSLRKAAHILAVAIFAFSAPAMAEEPKLLSTHGDWTAYAFKENGGTVCYMASQPKKSEGN